MLGRKRIGLSIWFLGHARTDVHTIRLLPNGFRDESTISCSFAVIVTQKSAEPFPAHHLTSLLTYFPSRNQQPVAHPLMVALCKKMIQIDNCGGLERFLSEEDHPLQALLLQAPHKALMPLMATQNPPPVATSKSPT